MEFFFVLEFFFVIICVFAFFYVLHRIDPVYIGSTHINDKKSDLTLIEINVICEVPFYFINIIIIDKIIRLGTNMTLTPRHEFDFDLKA